MSTKDTGELLRMFAENGSEDAFHELVSRYINLVYSVALRRVGGDEHQAQDVAQTVFIDFARKARSWSSGVQLGGWLHRHTCFVATNFTRSERRRLAREQIAVDMNQLSETPDADWKSVAPVLDDAINQLEEPDRHAVVLRFYECHDLRVVGAALGVSEDTAQKRVSRALEKLRALLLERGVSLSITALVATLSSQAIVAAPAGFSPSISSKAFAKTAGGAGLLALLTPSTTKIFCVLAALVAGLAVVKWKQSRSANEKQLLVQPPSATVANDATGGALAQVAPAGGAAFALPGLDTAPTNSEIIRLTILAADSGKPVPNVLVDYRGWMGKKFTGKKFLANRLGICDVLVVRETLTDLQLTTRIDGFADTRLFWRPDRGEQIPTNYTVRLARSATISGRVVDSDDQPVEASRVGFNHGADPVSDTPPQDHQFTWIEVLTDSEGHWKIDRIADEMIRRIYGSARHSNHVSSPMVFIAKDRDAEKQLRDGTHVFRLGRSVNIRGTVVGPDNQPVSDARVFVGAVGSGGKRETVTGFDGSFTVAGCKPGKNLVTAEAKGFAPTTVEVQAGMDSQPILLKLGPGKTLRLRVVDRMNQPVPGTFVWLRTFGHGGTSPSNLPPVQTEFKPKTDAEGRAVWKDAPDREMVFDFQAAGFMRLNEVKLRPDGQEHVVTLPPALTVLGSVRDVSGSPVPRFRIICGWPSEPADSGVMWSTLERFWPSFAGGEYRHVFDEAVIMGTANRGYVLKFEAEGYAPFVSRVIRADEIEARVDVMLMKAESVKATVFLPNGRPASYADVGLAFPGARLQLVPGGFSRESVQNGNSLRRTDAQGIFQLSSDPTVTHILIAHNDGYTETTPAALAADPIVRLQPWSRIEGTYISGGRPAAGRFVKFELHQSDFNLVATDNRLFQAQTDAQGRFIFPKVPPGRHKLVRLLIETNGTTTSWMNRPLVDVDASPGETKIITLSSEGYTVTARLREPEGFKRNDAWRVFGSVTTPFPEPPLDVEKNSEALAKWLSSPEIKALAARVLQYPLTQQSEGVWQAEDVPPGTYHASFSVMRTQPQPGGAAEYLSGRVTITIPADPPSGTLDIGEIIVRKPGQQ